MASSAMVTAQGLDLSHVSATGGALTVAGSRAQFPLYNGFRRTSVVLVQLRRQQSAPDCSHPRSLVVRAAARPPPAKSAGNQLARFLGRAPPAEEEKPPQQQRPKFGTQLFSLGGKKEEGEEGKKEDGASSSSFALQKASPFSGLQVFGRGRAADAKTVFVANATGQIGSRIALALLRQGFKVRAGVSDLQQAQKLAETASTYGLLSADEARRLNVVEFNVRDEQLTAKAIGNAGKVVVSLGGTEGGPTGPRVAPPDAARVVEAAILARIPNVAVVAERGGASAAAEAGGGFFSQLFSVFRGGGGGGAGAGGGAKSLQGIVDRLADSEVNYTVIEAATSAGVPDSYSANLVLAPEGQAAPGQISRLQIGDVVASVFSNVGAAQNKVFQVTTSADAPARPIDDLLSAISEDTRRATLEEARARAAAEEREKAKRAAAEEKERRAREAAQVEAARAAAEAKEAREAAQALEAEARQLAAQEAKAAEAASRAKQRAQAAASSVSGLASRVKEVGGSDAPLSSPFAGGNGGPASPLGALTSIFRPKGEAEEETVEEEEEPPKGRGFGGLGAIIPKLPGKAEEVKREVEKAAPKPKLQLPSLPSFGGPAPPKGPQPAGPKGRAAAAPPAKRKAPPPPRPPPKQPPPPKAGGGPKGKGGGIGGLFGGGDTVYIDTPSAGDF